MPADTVTFRPTRLRLMAGLFSIGMTVLSFVGWILLPTEITDTVTPFQAITLLLVLAVMIFVMLSIAASMVRADGDGLRIRNGLRTHDVPWSRVHKLIMRDGDPWAYALLTPEDGRPFVADLDAERLMLMGIQANDRAAALRAIGELQRRHAS